MTRDLAYLLLLCVGMLSCESKRNGDNSSEKMKSKELAIGDSINTRKQNLIFNFSDTISKYKQPILFYMRTDWCRGCKSVEENRISQKDFRDLVDENFKFYKIDGDLPYQFHLKDSIYKKHRLMNDFMYAFYEPSEMASYPSFMIISEKEQVKTVVPPQFKAKHSDMVNYFVSLSE